VLGLITEGRGDAAIASALRLSEKAEARRASQIYEALGLAPSLADHRRVLAVACRRSHESRRGRETAEPVG
jgi:hypothetical protein